MPGRKRFSAHLRRVPSAAGCTLGLEELAGAVSSIVYHQAGKPPSALLLMKAILFARSSVSAMLVYDLMVHPAQIGGYREIFHPVVMAKLTRNFGSAAGQLDISGSAYGKRWAIWLNRYWANQA